MTGEEAMRLMDLATEFHECASLAVKECEDPEQCDGHNAMAAAFLACAAILRGHIGDAEVTA